MSEPVEFDPDWCIRPGVTLAEMMSDGGLTGELGVSVLARLSQLASDTIRGVLDGSVEITEDIAQHLAVGTRPLAISAQFWLNLERRYRDGLAAGKHDMSGPS